jgi:holo-[acyl-carrier protein] synthase
MQHNNGGIRPPPVPQDIKGPVAGVGVDLIRIRRVEQAYLRRPERFLHRIFSLREQALLSQRNYPPATLAARFAAKEAVAKALGCGIGPVRWYELEIVPGGKGAPYVCLRGEAERLARQRGIDGVAVSLAHDGPWAMAFAVAYKKQEARSKKQEVGEKK